MVRCDGCRDASLVGPSVSDAIIRSQSGRFSVRAARGIAELAREPGQHAIDHAGPHELHVSVPNLAPHRVGVTVPQSRTLQLPVIRLSLARAVSSRSIGRSRSAAHTLLRYSTTSSSLPCTWKRVYVFAVAPL